MQRMPPGVLDQTEKFDTVTNMRTSRRLLIGAFIVATLAVTATTATWFTSRSTGNNAVTAAATLPEINACKSATDVYSCLTQAVERLDVTDTNVVNDFFTSVKDDKLGPGCYGAAERLGQLAWSLHGEGTFTLGTPACETGYLHGALIAAAESGVSQEDIAVGCETAKSGQRVDELWTPSMMLTCLVGVGRALAVYSEDVVEGSAICEKQLAGNMTEEDGKFKAVDFCVRGIVLEELNNTIPVRMALEQCLQLSGTRADACIALGVRGPASQSEAAVTELGELCKKITDEHARYCFFALSDAIATLSFFEKRTVPTETLELCSTEIDCLGHFAKYVLNATWDPQVTIDACAVFPGDGQRQCAGSVPGLTEDGIRQGHIPESKRLAATATSTR